MTQIYRTLSDFAQNKYVWSVLDTEFDGEVQNEFSGASGCLLLNTGIFRSYRILTGNEF